MFCRISLFSVSLLSASSNTKFYCIDNNRCLNIFYSYKAIYLKPAYKIIFRQELLNQRSLALSILQRPFLRTITNKYSDLKSLSVLR